MNGLGVGIVILGLGLALYAFWVRRARAAGRRDAQPEEGPHKEADMRTGSMAALSRAAEEDVVLLKALGDGRYETLGERFDSAEAAGRHLTRELVRAYYPEWLPEAGMGPAPADATQAHGPRKAQAEDKVAASRGRHADDAARYRRPARQLTATITTADGARATLRPATAADAARVAALANALDREVGDGTEPHSAETVVSGMLSGAAGLALWVVEPESGGGAVGYALVQDLYDTDGAAWASWLHDLYIDADWRSRDIGARLMAHLAAAAEADGHRGLWWGVHRSNWKAERFYRRLGAHRAPIHVMGVAGPTLHALARKAA